MLRNIAGTSSLAASVTPTDDLNEFCTRPFFPQYDVVNKTDLSVNSSWSRWRNRRNSIPGLNP